MCTGVEITAAMAAAAPYIAATSAAVGVGSTVYGATQSSAAQSRAADAVRQQNITAQQAQNQAFQERSAATRRQGDAQFGTAQRETQDRTVAAQAMRTGQAAALERQRQTLEAENATAEQLRGQGDARARELLAATSGQVQDQSQQGYQDRAAEILAATQADTPMSPEATNPDGSGAESSTNDGATKVALARRMGLAAANVRQYGKDLARVGSYGQPFADTSQAIQANQGGIMPAQNAARLLASGAGTRLLPSQMAYTGATNTGQSEDALIRQRAAQENQLAGLDFGNTTGLANLGQTDTTTDAANKTRQATSDAEWQKQIGGLFAGLGSLGSYGAGMYGPNLRTAFSPTKPT